MASWAGSGGLGPCIRRWLCCIGLLDEPHLSPAGDRLAALVAASNDTITTGFAGTPYICDALTQTGHLDSATGCCCKPTAPLGCTRSPMGATTIWELWDSMLPDGTIHPGGMTCFDHYALGAVADWMHRVIAGVETAEPGYSRVGDRPPTRRQPHLGPRITADLLRPGHRLLGDHRQRRPHHHRRPAQRHNRRRHRARTAAGDRGLRPPHPQRAQMYKHARTAAAIPRTVRSDTAACPRRAREGSTR